MAGLRVIVMVLTLVVAACGDGDGSPDGNGFSEDGNGSLDDGLTGTTAVDDTSPDDGAPPPMAVDACRLLTQVDAEQILGKPVELLSPPPDIAEDESWCDWVAEDSEEVRIIVVAGSRAQEEWTFSQMFNPDAEELDIGDGALYRDGDPRTLIVVSGNVHFTLMLFLLADTAVSDPRGRLIEQAGRVLPRL